MPLLMSLKFELGGRDPHEFRRYLAGILLRDCNDKMRRAASYRLRWTADMEEMNRTIAEAEALEREATLIRDSIAGALWSE